MLPSRFLFSNKVTFIYRFQNFLFSSYLSITLSILFHIYRVFEIFIAVDFPSHNRSFSIINTLPDRNLPINEWVSASAN